MSDREPVIVFYEYGYRVAGGSEFWEQDYGSDGAWIRQNREYGITVIDIRRNGRDVECIYKALDDAGCQGVALRREVVMTTGSAEIIARDTP